MLSRNILSAFRTGFKNQHQFHKYKQLSAFSTFTPTIKTDFYIDQDARKRFYIDPNATLSNVESLLKKEDKSYQSIVFKLDDKEIQDKETLFVETALKQNLKVEINRQIIPVHLDLNGPAAYSNETPYDNHLASNEVPIYDALLITDFTKIFQENLEKRHSKHSFEAKELHDALNATLQHFKAKAEDKAHVPEQVVEQLIVEQVKDRGLYDELIRKAQSKSTRILKYAIVATLVQWVVLFYLTYYEVGWDVTEPIAYLISLAIEGLGIYFYVRYAKGFRQKSIFEMAYQKNKWQTLRTKSVNPEVELSYLSNKINYFTQRVMNSKAI